MLFYRLYPTVAVYKLFIYQHNSVHRRNVDTIASQLAVNMSSVYMHSVSRHSGIVSSMQIVIFLPCNMLYDRVYCKIAVAL